MRADRINSIIEGLDEISLDERHRSAVVQVAGLVQQVLNYLPRSIPQYTDHGVQHSNNLMRRFSNFLENLQEFNLELTEEERWLVCLAIWLHDIGCLIAEEGEREKHNEYSVQLLERVEFGILEDILGSDILKCLKFVVISHSSNYCLEQVPKEPLHPNIRLRLICAIFRLLDGCDITSARTKRVLYEILKAYNLLDQKSKKFWEAHRSISSAVFEGDTIKIDCDNTDTAELLIEHLEKDLREINRIFSEERFPTFRIEAVSIEVFQTS